MEGVDSISSNLIFNAANFAATQNAAGSTAKANQTRENGPVRKKAFKNALEKSRAENELIKLDLPPELAEMDTETAAVHLKDAADIAADQLRDHPTVENFAAYRKTVQRFLRYVEMHNFEIKKHQRPGYNRKGKPYDPRVQVKIINTRLDELSRYMLSTHRDTLRMLEKINEVKGILVDLLAA